MPKDCRPVDLAGVSSRSVALPISRNWSGVLRVTEAGTGRAIATSLISP